MPGRKGSLGGMNRNYTITSLPVRASSTGAESGGADSTFSRKMAAPYRPELVDDEIEQEEDEWFEENGKSFDELLLRKYIREVIENEVSEMNTVASVGGVGANGNASSPFGYTLPLGMKGKGNPNVDVYKTRKKRKKRKKSKIKESTLPPDRTLPPVGGVQPSTNTQRNSFRYRDELRDFNENNTMNSYLSESDLIGEGGLGGSAVFLDQRTGHVVKIFKKQRKLSSDLELENYSKVKSFQQFKSLPRVYKVGEELNNHYYVVMEKLNPLSDNEKSFFMQSVHPLFEPGYQQNGLFDSGGIDIFKSTYHDTFINLLREKEERIDKINASLKFNISDTVIHKTLYRASKQMIKRRDLMTDENAEQILVSISKAFSKQSNRNIIIKKSRQSSNSAFTNFKIAMQEDVQVTSDPTRLLNFINTFFKKLSQYLDKEINFVRSLIIECMKFANRIIQKKSTRVSSQTKVRIYSMISSCIFTDMFLAPIGFKTTSHENDKFGKGFKASDLGGPAGGKHLIKTLKKSGNLKMVSLLNDIQKMKKMNIVPADIHSENIMKRPNGDYVIADLGAFKFK